MNEAVDGEQVWQDAALHREGEIGDWRSGGCERGKERPKGINGSGSRVGVNYKAEAEHGDGDSWRQDGDIYVNVRATTEGQAT